MPNSPRQELPVELQTVKTKLIEAFVAALRLAPFKTPHVDYEVSDMKLFEYARRGVLDDINMQEAPACRVEIGDETKFALTFPITEKQFRLYVHFKVEKVVGVDPGPIIEYYFGRITETLVTAEHFAGIAMDVSEVGNAPQTQGKDDPEPGGTIWFDVQYRHGYGNYFSETGNA